jgi:hypothetical protein
MFEAIPRYGNLEITPLLARSYLFFYMLDFARYEPATTAL